MGLVRNRQPPFRRGGKQGNQKLPSEINRLRALLLESRAHDAFEENPEHIVVAPVVEDRDGFELFKNAGDFLRLELLFVDARVLDRLVVVFEIMPECVLIEAIDLGDDLLGALRRRHRRD